MPGATDARMHTCHPELDALNEVLAYLDTLRIQWPQALDRLGAYLDEQTTPPAQPTADS